MTEAPDYAESVVRVLREHTPFLADPFDASIVTELIHRQLGEPRDSFEVIVDSPHAGNWRLKARSDDRRRVRLACFHRDRRAMDDELERTVNDALKALEG